MLIGCSRRAAPPAPPPDILVVVLDTVRADRLPPYGHSRPTAPHFTQLATSGLLFEDATAPSSWTWPSHASLFTGQSPWQHGAHSIEQPIGGTDLGNDFRVSAIRDGVPTLAERLTAAGYQTAAFSTNPLLSAEFGLMRGFSQVHNFEKDPETIAAFSTFMAEEATAPRFVFVNLLSAHMPWGVTPVPWSERHASALTPTTCPTWLCPYLDTGQTPVVNLYRSPGYGPAGVFHFMAGRLAIPPEGLELLRDLYDGHVSLVDYHLGQALESWSAYASDSVMVVTSDHGEYLGEHGMLDHGYTLYPEVTRIPLLIVAPGRVEAGERDSRPVQLQDLYPTLLGFAGVSDSMPGNLMGPPDPDRKITAGVWANARTAVLMSDEPQAARLTQGWHFYRDGDDALILGRVSGAELYDLENDPGMLTDLAPQAVERVEALRAASAEYFVEVDGVGGAEVQAQGAVLERLRGLGYVE
jgi:arylsulfatase A-like enzyme